MGQPSVGFHRPTKSSFLLHFWAHFLAGEVSPRQRNFVNFQKDFVTFSKSPKNFGKRLSFDFFVKKTLFEGQKPRFFKFWRIRCRNMEFHRPPLASEVWIRDPQYLWNGSNLKDIALLLLIKNSIRMSICALASRDFFNFMLQKIVITTIFLRFGTYILYAQLVFNCTPFVNLMTLLNGTIIIIMTEIVRI